MIGADTEAEILRLHHAEKWQRFRFLFSGAGNVIYAVDEPGRLLRYVDASQTGGGDVSSPQVIGQGDWQQFTHLFSAANAVLYAVDQVSVPSTGGSGPARPHGGVLGGSHANHPPAVSRPAPRPPRRND